MAWALAILLRALVLVLLTGCGGAPGLVAIEEAEYQWGERPAPDAWKPVRTNTEIAPRGVPHPTWMRVRTPAIDAPDPALRLSRGLHTDEIWVGDRRIDTIGTTLIVPLPAHAETVLVRFAPDSIAALPSLYAGSQRALWTGALARELPELVIAGTLLLSGLLLLAATLRRGGARAYRGLGVFLGALGAITLTQLNLLRGVLITSPLAMFLGHEVAIFVYPMGFADFVLAIFGDVRRRIIGRALAAYMVYAALAWALHFAGVIDLQISRVAPNLFMLFVSALSIALAVRRARAGDGAARAFLWGFGVLLAVAMPDILDGLGFRRFDFQTVPYGVLAFGAAMSVVTERRLSDLRDALATSAGELSRKVETLEDRNREVQSLNAELRHQIAERSKQLADALTGGLALPAAARSLSEGDVVGGRYRVVRALGRGGMGAVHEAVRASDGKRVALKVMNGLPSAEDAARFAREAEIAARVADPNLVAVVDVGSAGGDLMYLVMELVEGRSLHDEKPRFGDVGWAISVLSQIASALAALHRAGVVHRDLKPSNVLLARAEDGREIAKISDFGISRFGTIEDDEGEAALVADTIPPRSETGDLWVRPAAETVAEATTPARDPANDTTGPTSTPRRAAPLTATGAVMGTPAYMAPELAHGARRAKPASDMFAFGLMAYEMLAGRPAYSTTPILLALTDGLPEPEPLPSAVPASISAMVRRCLEAPPERRPTAGEAAAVLARAAETRAAEA